jgi:hypothetical protein
MLCSPCNFIPFLPLSCVLFMRLLHALSFTWARSISQGATCLLFTTLVLHAWSSIPGRSSVGKKAWHKSRNGSGRCLPLSAPTQCRELTTVQHDSEKLCRCGSGSSRKNIAATCQQGIRGDSIQDHSRSPWRTSLQRFLQ